MLLRYNYIMKPQQDPVSEPEKVTRPQGIPGLGARSRGFSAALSPLIAMVFGAGFVVGAIFRPDVLNEGKAALLLLLLAGGLYITWKRAVLIYLRHEEGARGEEQVARVLDALPEPWQSFHNVLIGDKQIDHVLVGPNHVYSIETVHWKGQVRLVNKKLMHGDLFYPGYDLESLISQSHKVATELKLDEKAVTPMVCIVGGRYGNYPGVKEGVWLGEIQDIGVYLLSEASVGVSEGDRTATITALESKIHLATLS